MLSHIAGVMKKVIKFHPKVANLPTLNWGKHPLKSKYIAKKCWEGIVKDLIEVDAILNTELDDKYI